MEKSKYGVHEGHCCILHGCKYGDDDCPVISGEIRQEFTCESCDDSGIPTVDEAIRQGKMERKGQLKVEVSVEPDEEMAKKGTPYSWCLKAYGEPEPYSYSSWRVMASGWSASHAEAFQAACAAIPAKG